jgi:hypothetical protein
MTRGRRRLLIVASLLVEPLALWLRGYPIGGRIVVRCRQGHLFTTLWIPGASLKSVHFLWWRFQRCPVGEHWTIVTPVRTGDLTAAQRHRAHAHRDLPIP